MVSSIPELLAPLALSCRTAPDRCAIDSSKDQIEGLNAVFVSIGVTCYNIDSLVIKPNSAVCQ